jgi:hypothetical protein
LHRAERGDFTHAGRHPPRRSGKDLAGVTIEARMPSSTIRFVHAVHPKHHLTPKPDLFGTVSIVKEWGRIGQPGMARHKVFSDEAAAQAALVLRMQKKIGRGYHVW